MGKDTHTGLDGEEYSAHLAGCWVPFSFPEAFEGRRSFSLIFAMNVIEYYLSEGEK